MRAPAGRRRPPRRLRSLPRVVAGTLQAERDELVALPVGGLDSGGDRRNVERVDEDCSLADDLLHRAAGARHDGRAARHRLERGDAEALVERREDEAARAAVRGGELLVVDPAEPGDVLAGDAASPHPGAPTSRSSTPARAAASTTRARFLRGSSVPTASTYSPSAASPSERKTGSSAFGTTSTRSGSTPASSTTSRFENSETAMTRSAARIVGRSAVRP